MYRLDVLTELGTFTVHSDEITNIDDSEAIVGLVDIQSDLLGGGFFKGWLPETDRDMEPTIFAFGNDIKVYAYHFYSYIEPVEVPEIKLPEEGTPYPFSCQCEYLGNKLTVQGVKCHYHGITLYLPTRVNGDPHTSVVKQQTLESLLKTWVEENGTRITEYLVLVPDVFMEYQVAAEYLVDYLGGVDTMKGKGKAKAWPAWNDKD